MKYISTLFICILSTIALNAQENPGVQEIQRSMSQGIQYGLEVNIPEATIKVAQEQWLKFVKQFKGKTKYNKNTMEIKSDNSTIADMSSNSIDIYVTLTDDKTENKVVAGFWFDMGGIYLNAETNPEKIKTAENLINTYVKHVRVAMAEIALANEEKELKGLKGDLKTLQRQNEKYHTKIAEAEKIIKEMNANIATNLVGQQNKQVEISAQLEVVTAGKAKIARIKM